MRPFEADLEAADEDEEGKYCLYIFSTVLPVPRGARLVEVALRLPLEVTVSAFKQLV